MFLISTPIQHNKKIFAYLAKSPFIIALQRRGLLSTNSAQRIFPKTTVPRYPCGSKVCDDGCGVISCGCIESLALGVLAAREGGCWPAGAVVRACHCHLRRWLSSPPTVVRHRSCGESCSFAVLAQTVPDVQSALQTSRFPTSPRLAKGLQVASVKAVDVRLTNMSFCWKYYSIFIVGFFTGKTRQCRLMLAGQTSFIKYLHDIGSLLVLKHIKAL